jgi:hypothetical protein
MPRRVTRRPRTHMGVIMSGGSVGAQATGF